MKTLLFLGNIGTGEIILIALVVLLLWGGKKIQIGRASCRERV